MSSIQQLSTRMTVSGGLSTAKQYRAAKLYSKLNVITRMIYRGQPASRTLKIGARLMTDATAIGCTAINGVTISA